MQVSMAPHDRPLMIPIRLVIACVGLSAQKTSELHVGWLGMSTSTHYVLVCGTSE